MIRACGGRSCAIAKSRVDLPQPDSPTIPRNSPAWSVRLTLSTALTSAASVRYETERFSTSSSGSDTSLSHRAESRIADLVECVVDEREPCAHEGDGSARRQCPQSIPGLERATLLGVVEHRPPGQLGA